MPLAFTYPLMKRYTYWPQLFRNYIQLWLNPWMDIGYKLTSLIPIFFYFGAIFWTLGYDTIYRVSDIKDDEIIGLKSTAIKFKSNPCTFLYISYSIFIVTLILIGFLINLNIFYFIFLVMIGLHMYYFQIFKFNFKDPANCLKIFKSNNLVGLLVFIGLMVGKI